jgi:hypothetical protein
MLPAVTGGKGGDRKSKVIVTLDSMGIERMQSSRFHRIAQVPDDRNPFATGAALTAPAVVVEIGVAVPVVVSGAAGTVAAVVVIGDGIFTHE